MWQVIMENQWYSRLRLSITRKRLSNHARWNFTSRQVHQNCRTDKKCYATFKLNKVPESYKIAAKYGSTEITKTLKVKHAVTLKAVKVKKSAKRIVLKAILKQGKKALKYKKVTFKFKGKNHKAKTNKKGVAKVTIKNQF